MDEEHATAFKKLADASLPHHVKQDLWALYLEDEEHSRETALDKLDSAIEEAKADA